MFASRDSYATMENAFVHHSVLQPRNPYVRLSNKVGENTNTSERFLPAFTGSCPPNEELQPTPPCCEPTCGNNCTEECRVELVNQPTCVCMPGYVRHEGCCIKADQCPTCGPYARYSDCTPCCESTCTMDCSVVLCLAGCTGPPTCLCQTGYVKHNGVCIKRELCPIEGSSSEQPPFPIGYDHGLGQEISSGGPDVPFVRYPGKTYK